jgi:hypothetical protein
VVHSFELPPAFQFLPLLFAVLNAGADKLFSLFRAGRI